MLPTAPEIVHEHEPENSEPAPRALIDAGFYTPLGPAFRRNHAAFPAPSFVDSWRLTISSAFNDNDPPDNISERELWSGGLDELKARSESAAPHLLAYKAQGEPLPLEHGAPLRLVTPGVIGARSIKWLEKIRILPFPSTNSFMTHDYKILPSTIVDPTEAEKEKAMEAAEPLMAFGISCACLVADGRTGEAKGWAIGAEGVPLDRIEVACIDLPTAANHPSDLSPADVRMIAADLPASAWRLADLERGPASDGAADGKEWGWVIWSASLGLFSTGMTPKSDRVGWVVVRCVDRDGREQERESQWNIRGVGMAGWSVKCWDSADGEAS